MIIELRKSKKWHEGYVSVMDNKGGHLSTKPIGASDYDTIVGNYKSNKALEVTPVKGKRGYIDCYDVTDKAAEEKLKRQSTKK